MRAFSVTYKFTIPSVPTVGIKIQFWGLGVNVRKIVQSVKTIKKVGKWAEGPMKRSSFPLSKSRDRVYKLANRRWRIVTFEACGLDCCLLINYSKTLLQYQAMLGVDSGGDMKVLASLEYHPTHKPWHAHVRCDDIESVPSGIKRGPSVKSMNAVGVKHRLPCPVSDDAALSRAWLFFRLDLSADLQEQGSFL